MGRKRSDILQLLLSLGIVILSSFLLTFYFFKLDLTEEKRHSLTPATEDLLANLQDPLFIRCYLHGEFPAEFKRLENSIKERLDEFVDYSRGKIDYEFIDPYESGDQKIINETFKALDEKGLRFSNISFNENGAQASKLIWPAAIVEYQGREYPIQFLKTETPVATDQMVNTSVNNLEYELANGLRKITRKDKPAVAILTGHREIPGINLADFIYGLRENYDVEPVRIDSQINAFSDKADAMALRTNRYAALVVAGPDSVISDKDRFVIDQFIMNGGKVLWMLDALKINMDSLRNSESSMAVSNENGVYEMLFEYGVRLNRSLVIDFQGAPIILDNGPMGNQRAYTDRTNYYAPLLLSSTNTHPITANLDPLKMEFAGSLDSVNANSDVIKIHLLKPDAIKKDPNMAYRDKSLPTKMIVIADGDFAYNDVDMRSGKPMPIALGYDPQFRRVLFDNKEFLMNCMNYLLDDQALISVRSRTIELRKLAEDKIQTSSGSIKLLNTLVPIIAVILMGVVQFVWRKKRWTQKAA